MTEKIRLSKSFISSGIVLHLVIWLLFISYELSFILVTTTFNASISHLVIYYLLNIGLFYFNAHVLLDYAFFHTRLRYLNAVWLIIIELFVYLILKYGLDAVLTDLPKAPVFIPVTKMYLSYNLWRGIYFVGISTAYFSTVYMLRFRDRNYQMETEQLKSKAASLELENKYVVAENAYLQNQISPHLLFNTLNFIYNTVYLRSEKAGKGVMLLADLMRYSLVSSEQLETVPLLEEAGQINNLIELSKLRFEEEMLLSFIRKGKLKDLKIIPLLLVTLVENMVKHGDLWDRNYRAMIRLDHADGILSFSTSNRKRSSSPYLKSGIGLRNLEKRLMNHYENRYTLIIEDTDQIYTVKLTIQL